ncbi:PQQ-dependent sugar dehydrogenase [Solwaraspora sp. WMMD1047]|uniref:PQQ-dependent sugar dehydrogenase n=1 Tax=Solwaraspora sp. WMMD1047 TaxID=3016102 RepID=UPI00241747F9|nr:PQQ-dependent sugar dehydrogenase [Solwaraspora sp. WMMD1047]MDG4828833.1 PQQ-dependent sugar dehydrogenase [Solwaraspora sp. WMMD1047]
MSGSGLRALRAGLAVALVVPVAVAGPTVSAGPATVGGAAVALAGAAPAGFTQQVVFAGLTRPTKLAFAPDGRVFVAEKSGLIKVFRGLADPVATVFADLRTQVYDYKDLGLIGLTLAPTFPDDPWVYVSYSYDGVIGGSAPTYRDTCPAAGSCVSSARISRLRADGDAMTGTEHVLVHDWCTQIESHSVGDLAFGRDGALYATGGDGASGTFVDYGQTGNPVNPCGDPPGPVGAALAPPSAEGGALRSQDLRTPDDPTGLSGTFIRINPVTGAALPDNPLAHSADPNARRILAYGLRNPYRWTFHPDSGEVWFGDVGWRDHEEIDRLAHPGGPPPNYGWPCYEGNVKQGGYRVARLGLCDSLYSAPPDAVTPPYYSYSHSQQVATGDGCPAGGSSPSGLAFYPATGGGYPAGYRGALFFADYARRCVWLMRAGSDGLPDPTSVQPFSSAAGGVVDLQIGPERDLYLVDLTGGTVRRFHFDAADQPPRAVVRATPEEGNAPLEVLFDGSASTDADPGDILRHEWDFTGDGSFDATGVTASHTYRSTGTYSARLRVTDLAGRSDTATIQIRVGTSAPRPVITSPLGTAKWSVGQQITFSGRATEAGGAPVPADRLEWQLINRHCPTVDNCHTHTVQHWTGVAAGAFVAPDHEYPSYLELTLTATGSGGLSASTTTRLDPRWTRLNMVSNPSGLEVNVDGVSYTTPAAVKVVVGATTTMSAPGPQSAGVAEFVFDNWSNGGAQTQVVIAPPAATTYTATFATAPGCRDSAGYTCTSVVGAAYQPADQAVLPLTGDDARTPVDLPFPVLFYGRRYERAWVSTNGFLSFQDPGLPGAINAGLPDAGLPNAAVHPFWDDLVVRADSSVRSAVRGSAPNREFVVEWRDVYLYGSSTAKISFQLSLAESGRITFNYAGLTGTSLRELGSGATVGIEDGTGGVALAYSVNHAVLVDGRAVVFNPPPDR